MTILLLQLTVARLYLLVRILVSEMKIICCPTPPPPPPPPNVVSKKTPKHGLTSVRTAFIALGKPPSNDVTTSCTVDNDANVAGVLRVA